MWLCLCVQVFSKLTCNSRKAPNDENKSVIIIIIYLKNPTAKRSQKKIFNNISQFKISHAVPAAMTSHTK